MKSQLKLMILETTTKSLLKCLNNYYIHFLQETAGLAQKTLGSSTLAKNNGETNAKIMKYYEDHQNLSKIREKHENLSNDFPKASVGEINKTIKKLNPRKATGPGGVLIRVIKTA